MTVSKKIIALIFFCPVFIFAQSTTDSLPLSTTETDSLLNAPLSPMPLPDSVAIKKDATSAISNDSTAAPIKKTAPVIEETEEELILEGGEESLIPTIAVEKVQSVVAPADSVKDSTVSSTTTQSDTAQDTSTVSDKSMQIYPVSPIVPPPEEKVELRVEKTQSINFAKNFKEYRSPKIAILLSLLVPGTGQAYAHNYLKTGIFGAVEATFITVAAIFGYQGSKKWDKARSFANEHFSVDHFEEYYMNLSNPGNFSDTVLKQIFDPDSNASNFLRYSGDKSKDDDFYDYIRDPISPYVQGWDDVQPRFDSDFGIENPDVGNGHYVQDEDSLYLVYFVNENGDSTESQYGFSENQKLYNDKITDANNKYRWSKNFITFLLVNHVASAVDAAITAKAHNDKLLGKSTVWQNINLRESIVNTPVGAANGLAIEVRF